LREEAGEPIISQAAMAVVMSVLAGTTITARALSLVVLARIYLTGTEQVSYTEVAEEGEEAAITLEELEVTVEEVARTILCRRRLL
jgi:hypothetical protein